MLSKIGVTIFLNSFNTSSGGIIIGIFLRSDKRIYFCVLPAKCESIYRFTALLFKYNNKYSLKRGVFDVLNNPTFFIAKSTSSYVI